MRDRPKLSPRFVLAVIAALTLGTTCGLFLLLTLAIGLFY